MDVFNGNSRLEDHVMYALNWAIFLRRDLDGPLIPFMNEWKEEEMFISVLHAGGDPEEFAYRQAEKSTREGDQFILGYEGMLQDENGEKMDAFIIKGYDRTQGKGVFIAQKFQAKEKFGQYKVLGDPIFISNPELPFPINESIEKNYTPLEYGSSGMSLKNGEQIGIFSHENPAVNSNNIKSFIRHHLSDPTSEKVSGNLGISIAPMGGNSDFLKYTTLRTIETEKEREWIKNWESQTGKKVRINCSYGDEKWLVEYDDGTGGTTPSSENPTKQEPNTKTEAEAEEDALVTKYRLLSKAGLDQEFFRIASVPNARTNIDCLKAMVALMKVYEEQGLEMPGKGDSAPRRKPQNSTAQKPKSGCAGMIVLLIVCSFVIQYLFF